ISELPSYSAVTPTEPVDYLIMEDEHLDTILATESDEFIKYCAENLVPTPSESEGENGCDVPAGFTTFFNVLFDDDYDSDSSDDQSLSVEDVREKIYSNPLFDEEIIPMQIDQHSFNAEFDLIESLPNHDSSIIISSKIDSLFDDMDNHGITSMNKEDECTAKVVSYSTPNTCFNDAIIRETNSSNLKIVKVASLSNEEIVQGVHVALPLAADEEISSKFANTLYGYFIGSWLAFPIVENYVHNAWAKYGFESVIAWNRFFFFIFLSHEGLVKVIDGGPWFIRSIPLMLNTWSANTKMKKEDCIRILVWIKIHNVPVVAFLKVRLSLITTQFGQPIKLDACTSDMCLNPWGRNTYARVLIELSLDGDIMDCVVVSIPFPNGTGHSLENLDVEYE
nr:hypothetical protein [Tanacetum cinerariifolium]